MTKPEKIQTGAPVSWQDIRGEDSGDLMLATQIIDVMEQGIIVWSPDGTCELHNTRVFDVLELERDAIGIGTKRDDFLDAACARGESHACSLLSLGLSFVATAPQDGFLLVADAHLLAP